MSRLNDLLRRLETSDPALAKDLKREVDALADRRAFGLNFERHVPEAVELPGRPVRRGDKVRILPPRGSKASDRDERLWRVLSVAKDADGTRTASLELISDEDETSDAVVDDLVVVAEFRDPIYPGLVSTGKVERGGDKPYHAVINAENYHALQTLLFTHRAKVDAIYIDPPYNTGTKTWIYDDRYVASDDVFKHSKWLAFMERRLTLARSLLKPSGVIIVAIGEDEHHRLRMLMDQVFEVENFIMNVTWQGGVSALARHHGGGVDYMLVYGRDATKVPQFRDPKPFAPEMLTVVREAINSGSTIDGAQSALRAFIKAHKNDIAPGLQIFNKVDAHGEIYLEGDLGNSLPRPNLRYPIVNPETGREYEPPTNGWEVSKDKMDALIANGRVIFGNRNVPARKKLLREHMDQLPSPTFYKDRRAASQKLRGILGQARFPNAKDPDVVQRWLRMVAPIDGVILDFFGGSGTTAEAVMRLNDEDGGSRSALLVTNNEVASTEVEHLTKDGHRATDPEWQARGVYEYVTRPRISTVASGVRADGTEYATTLRENVEFFTLTYEAPLRVSSNREFTKVAPLLWLRAGSQGRRIEDLSAGWDVADTYGVLADLNQSEAFIKAIANNDGIRLVFIVTDEDRLFESVVRELPDHVEPVRLYEAYLQNFEIETGRSAL